MTEVAKELLEDVQPGDFVQVRYGTDYDQTLFEGTIIKWTDNFLSLRDEDDEIIRIRLDDNLRALQKGRKTRTDSLQKAFENESSIVQAMSFPVSHHPKISRQMVVLPPSKPFGTTPNSCIESAKGKIKLAESVEFKRVANSVLDALLHAVKNNEVAEKYHNLRAKLRVIQDECGCDADYEAFYYLIGILSFIAKDYEYSIEPLVRVRDYLFAAYSASMGGLIASSQILSLCALLSKQSTDINQYISEICVARRDVDTLKRLLEDNKTDQDMCEKLASCAMLVFVASGSKLNTSITPYFSAYEATKYLLDAIPAEWSDERSALSWWEEFNKYRYPKQKKQDNTNGRIVGYIFKFDSEKKYGFISPNHYFYITQICDNSEKGILLRKMLSAGYWDGLEVYFSLGKSPTQTGSTAATAIELTEKGYVEALNRIATANKVVEPQKGFVEEYFPEHMVGRIQSSGKKYNFKLNAIVDPWLRAYYEQSFSPREQDVTFEAHGKNARNICWLNPDEDERQLFAGSLSSVDQEKWETFLSKGNSRIEITLSETDPYMSYSYRDLPEIESSFNEDAGALFTWNGISLIENNQSKAVLSSANATIKSTETRAPIVSRYESVTPSRSAQQGKSFAEQARKARIEGRLKDAELLFEKSLENNGFNEGVVADYISLCMQQDGKLNKAIELSQKYESFFSKEKFLDLKIQIYDKKKDYLSLCSLYESIIKLPLSISKKSHYYSRLIDAYIKTGNYMEGLSTCKKWQQFFNQNRFRADADKLKRAEPYINRQKTVCLYNLGNVEEAKKIATDLIRANPADTLASSILDGTYGKSEEDGNIELKTVAFDEIDAEDYYDEIISVNESQMSRFVRTLIQQMDIVSVLKTANVKDGRYIGTSKEALEDVNKLVGGRRVSAKTRSDSLFAACKLLEQIEQREDGSVPNTYKKYRYSGRAMASWGDLMVSQLPQLDTTRMAYLYTLKILRGAEQDWINSYNRYIKSYFLARIGVNSLEEYIVQQNNTHAKDGINTDVLSAAKIQPVLVPEFVVGILMLIKAISNQHDRMVSFIDDLFERNIEVRNAIVQQVHRLVATEIDESSTSFRKGLILAAEVLTNAQKDLQRVMIDISSTILSHIISDESMVALDPEKWKNFLTATDLGRLNRIHYIVKRSQDYHSSWDFENRSDCLRGILLESRELLEMIQKEPTDISYDIFLPALEQIVLKISEKQTDLYQDFLPKLSWRETIQPFRTPDGQIQVQLTIENEMNYQTADAISIENVVGPEITGFEKTSPLQPLRGGDEAEVGLVLSVSETANISGSFTATINYTYKCNDAPQCVITKNQDVEFTFILRNENFEPLTNPYSAYEGKVMDDDTMFVGRSAQIQQILEMICPNNDGNMNYGRAIAMYGQTRTGKSSLLYHIKKGLLERYQENILIWDIGNIGELPESKEYMANFLYNLLYIGDEAICENNSVSTIVEEICLTPPLQEIRREPDFAVTHFNTYMKKLNTILKKENKIIVLFIDEFTYLHGYIKEGKIPTDFMRFWKALLQNYCIFAIVAGQDDMPEFMREYQNEFACMELMKVNYLDERDIKVLVQKPLEIANNRYGLYRNDGSVQSIYDLTGGSAYLTIILCSKLVNYMNEKGAYMVTKGILNEFLRTKAFGPNGFLTEIHFEAQLQERGHRELDSINTAILLSIARLSQASGYAYIGDIECDGLSREEVQLYVERLVDRNVLAKEGREQYWIQVKLLERWLINTKGE